MPGFRGGAAHHSRREESDIYAYQDQPEARAAGLPAQDRSHGRDLPHHRQDQSTRIDGRDAGTPEGRHRADGGNALRAAMLGVKHGLVSKLSPIMGVAGVALRPHNASV